MITWSITFLLLAVVFSAVGFFGTDPGFVGQSACIILAVGFFVFALIILFRNHKHHRIH
jgi:membrane protein YdbS with pleckstrin-like domain